MTPPMAGPWLSPKLVSLNMFPNEFIIHNAQLIFAMAASAAITAIAVAVTVLVAITAFASALASTAATTATAA
jgi:hypothetical protein